MKNIVICFGYFFLMLLITYRSILNRKDSITLDAKQDAYGNVIVFSSDLEENDYIWEYLIGVYKDGIKVKPYDLEIRCSYQIDDCVKKAQDIQFGVDKKIIISPQSKIIFPKKILEERTVLVGIRTVKYEQIWGDLGFCIKNNRLIVNNQLENNNPDFITYCAANYYTPEQIQEQKRIASQPS